MLVSKVKSKIKVISIVIGLTLGLAACTPNQIAVFKSLNPSQQKAVVDWIQSPSKDCYEAIDKHWYGDKEWARKVVWRESRNIPAAANPASTARGCAQLLSSTHARRYTAVGCSVSQWSNPDCNIKAAWHLYKEAGARPWAATA